MDSAFLFVLDVGIAHCMDLLLNAVVLDESPVRVGIVGGIKPVTARRWCRGPCGWGLINIVWRVPIWIRAMKEIDFVHGIYAWC